MSGQLPVHLEEPPFLSVGTEVSAKYKGAFCEAKIKGVSKLVKCKVQYSSGSVALVSDDMIIGPLKVGTTVKIKCNDKTELIEAIIQKVQDFSQYTVVFDDGDITCLKRTSLCLKSGRHFATSATLDQLPLTHPEHAGVTQIRNCVINKRRSLKHKKKYGEIKDILQKDENDIGKVVCVQTNDKKKLKNNWFPGLIVSPTAQLIIKTNILIDYLVRSFKDGKYYTVPKKEIKEFTKEIASKVENPTLKTAVEKAILYLDNDELPPHWDRDLLFGIDKNYITSDSEGFNTDTSDEESIEEKDHFVAQLFKFMDDRGTPLNQVPVINGKDVDLYKLFKVVNNLGGYNKVNKFKRWKTIAQKIGHEPSVICVKQSYQQYLHSFEDFYRKLGCTMLSHPRGVRSRNSRFSRSIIRDIDKAQPATTDKNKPSVSTKQESSGKKDKPVDTSKDSVKKSVKSMKNEEKLSSINDKKKDSNITSNNSNKQSVKWDPHILENTNSKIKKDDSVETENVSINKKKKGIGAKNVFAKSMQKPVKKKNVGTLKTPDATLLGSRKIRAIKKRIKTIVKVITPFKKAKKSTCNIQQEISDAKLDENLPKLTRSKSKEDMPPIKRKLSVLSNHDDSIIESTTSGLNLENQNKIKHVDSSISEKLMKKKNCSTLNIDGETLNEDCIISSGDNLIVFYGDNSHTTTYDAKVLNICDFEGKIKYYVHYKGWNSRYDEWIDKSRIALKCNSPEPDDSDSLKCEKKNIDQKKLEKIINRTRRSVTPSSSSQVSKKLPFTSSVRLTRTCTLSDKSLTVIDNSDSETECSENIEITKQHNKKSYPSLKNIKIEPDVISKTEPSDIDQNKKLNLKTYPTKEMLIQKLSPKKLKSSVTKIHDNITEKIEMYDNVTLKKTFDFNFENETSTSNLNNEHVETLNDIQNIDVVQSELKIAPNHYLSPKEKIEIHNQQQMINENIEIATENSEHSKKSKITGLVYYKSSDDDEFELKKCKEMPLDVNCKISGTDFDLNIIRSEMKGLTVNNTESYMSDQQLKVDDLKSTESTADDIYEFKENEPCDLKTISSIIEEKPHRIAKHVELPNSYNFEKSVDLSNVIDENESTIPLESNKNDENFIESPNLKEHLIVTDNTKNSVSHIQSDIKSNESKNVINYSETIENSLNETCHIEIDETNIIKNEVLNLCTKVPDLLPNNMFMPINDNELDDDDDESKLFIEEVHKVETNYQMDTEEYNSNGQTEDTETRPLFLPQSIHKLSNADSEFQSSYNMSKDTDDESTVSCNESLQNALIQNFQMYTNFENQPIKTNNYQSFADDNNDNRAKSRFEFESNSISSTTEYTDNVQSTLNKPKTYEYDIKKPSYIPKNENVIFPELQCKEEIFDEDTLNNVLVIKYSRKSMDHDIHKPSTSKRFFDSIHETNKNNYETETSSNVKNNFIDIQQANLVKNVVFDTSASDTSKNVFYDNIASNDGKNDFYENIPSTKKSNSFDKPELNTNKKNYSSDGDINNVLLCEESIPGSPNGMPEDQEKISMRQEKKETYINPSTCEEKQAASVIYAINQSFNRPVMTYVGASNEEMNQYTNIIQNHGILDQRHLQFLAKITNRDDSCSIKPLELDVGQTVTKTKCKNSYEHNSVSKRSKMASTTILMTEGSNVQDSTEIKISVPQRDGNPLVLFTPDMNSIQRQALILAKINDLRKEYILIKSRISVVDRRRKKIKKRKKELLKRSIKHL